MFVNNDASNQDTSTHDHFGFYGKYRADSKCKERIYVFLVLDFAGSAARKSKYQMISKISGCQIGSTPFKRSSSKTRSPQFVPPYVNALKAPGFPSSDSWATSTFLKRKGMILPKRMLPEKNPTII